MNKTLRICNQCGCIHFPRTRQEVELEATNFGNYIQQQTQETQEQFGFGPLSKTKRVWDLTKQIKNSEHCFRCGNNYKNFRDVNENDKVPMGITIQGIIVEE